MNKEILKNIVAVMLIILYFMGLFYLEPIIGNKIKIISGILCLIFIIILIIIYRMKLDRKKFIKIITLIVITIGIVLRGMYISYTPITERQHDVYDINSEGHLGYIYTIYKTNKLPTTNNIQFYHPPLHHLISAQWLKLNDLFNIDFERSLEGLQILTAIYSSLIILVVYKILKYIKINDIYKLLTIAIIAFHPTFIILSGVINNDILMILLTFIAILYLIKWNDNVNLKNTIILALTTGLCVMTKISGAIIAIPILYVFFKKIIDKYKTDKKIINILFYIFLFAIIALPIGLWHPIRNKILFNQPIGGILIPGNFQYIGNYSIFDRFLTFSFKQTFCEMYTQIPGDYNIIANIIKTSIFGEFSYNNITFMFATIFKVVNLLLIISTIIAIFIELVKPKTNKENKLIVNMLLIFYFTIIVSYIAFNINFPYSCTMNFRYIVPTIFIGVLILLCELENVNKESIKLVIENMIVIFCLLSIIMFFTI